MPNDYENLAKVLMASPQGAKIVKSLDKLNAVANSDSGRQLKIGRASCRERV